MTGPIPHQWIKNLPRYEPGKTVAGTAKKAVKLSSNESPFGPSPEALAAYLEQAQLLRRYPDAAHRDLIAALAEKHGIEQTRIICGAGSDEILYLVARAFAGPGDEIIHSEYGFMMYPIIAKSVGARPVPVPEQNYRADMDAILAAVTERTRIVYLANPNNPTGTHVPDAEIRRLHAAMPKNVILVLDAAYAECVAADDYEPGLALARDADNVLMTRTFSKLYGLAALRLGWGYGSPAVIDAMDRLRSPFNVTSPALCSGAAALQDDAFLQKVRDHTICWRTWLRDQALTLGLQAPETETNFILVDFTPVSTASAEQANHYLTQKGYILRWLPGQGLGHCLRLTVGTEEENRGVITALQSYLSGLES